MLAVISARLLMALYLWLIIASNASAQTPRSWNFEVFLNDKKVGWHHFVLAALDLSLIHI